jgi:pilus assembly protein CpaE
MSVRIVMGCADHAVTEQFRTLLSEVAEMEVAEIVEDARDLVGAVDRAEADVLVLHEQLGALPVLELVREVTVARPSVGVVVLVREGTPELMAAAMEVGARSLLTLPLSLEELLARLEGAAQWSRTVRSHLTGDSVYGGRSRGRIVALAGAKGGVGTTVIAVQLALQAVAGRTATGQSSGRPADPSVGVGSSLGTPSLGTGPSVCLVDFDLQGGSVGLYLGVNPKRSVADLAEIAGEITLRSLRDIAFPHVSGLSLFVAPEHGERSEDMTTRAARHILSALRMQFDVVVVDCGTHVDDATAIAVELADAVLLVTTPDVPALRAAQRRINLWERLQITKSENVTVVLNRVSRRREVQPELARKIISAPLADTGIPANFRELEEPLNAGQLADARPGEVVRAVRALGAELGLLPLPLGHDARTVPRRVGRWRQSPAADSGQVAVETPAVVFLLLFACLVLFQMLLWGWSHIVAVNAASEGARTAAVGKSAGEVQAAVADALPAGWDSGYRVAVGGRTVSVTVQTPAIAPFLSGLDASATSSFIPEQVVPEQSP